MNMHTCTATSGAVTYFSMPAATLMHQAKKANANIFTDQQPDQLCLCMACWTMRRPHRDEEVDAVEALVRAQADPLRIESGDGVERHELQPAVLVREQAARHARAAPDPRPTHPLHRSALQAKPG